MLVRLTVLQMVCRLVEKRFFGHPDSVGVGPSTPGRWRPAAGRGRIGGEAQRPLQRPDRLLHLDVTRPTHPQRDVAAGPAERRRAGVGRIDYDADARPVRQVEGTRSVGLRRYRAVDRGGLFGEAVECRLAQLWMTPFSGHWLWRLCRLSTHPATVALVAVGLLR